MAILSKLKLFGQDLKAFVHEARSTSLPGHTFRIKSLPFREATRAAGLYDQLFYGDLDVLLVENFITAQEVRSLLDALEK